MAEVEFRTKCLDVLRPTALAPPMKGQATPQTTTLLDMARNLLALDSELTIYAVEPWTPASAAMLAEQEDDQGRSAAAAREGMRYFIEVFIAQDFLEQWIKEQKPSVDEICKNLIHCALDEWP